MLFVRVLIYICYNTGSGASTVGLQKQCHFTVMHSCIASGQKRCTAFLIFWTQYFVSTLASPLSFSGLVKSEQNILSPVDTFCMLYCFYILTSYMQNPKLVLVATRYWNIDLSWHDLQPYLGVSFLLLCQKNVSS